MVFIGSASQKEKRKPVAPQSELGHVLSFELKLELVRDQGDEFRIGGLALGVAYCVAEEPLQSVQIAPIPGDLDGVANGTLHSAWRGAEVLGYLGIEHLGDGVDGVPDGPPEGFRKGSVWQAFCRELIAFFVARCFLPSSGL